ncbi:hypothetical protein [Halarcobacter sp.]|uniref:hypothetical protein n=1 Tax=Halarcobacter sp. TaxID=2321133 RepID=UPI003A8CAC2C
MTKTMKGIVSSVAVASMLLFTGCGDNKEETKTAEAKPAAEKFVLKFSHVVSPNTPKEKRLITWKKT